MKEIKIEYRKGDLSRWILIGFVLIGAIGYAVTTITDSGVTTSSLSMAGNIDLNTYDLIDVDQIKSRYRNGNDQILFHSSVGIILKTNNTANADTARISVLTVNSDATQDVAQVQIAPDNGVLKLSRRIPVGIGGSGYESGMIVYNFTSGYNCIQYYNTTCWVGLGCPTCDSNCCA